MRPNIYNLALDFFRSPSDHQDLVDPSVPLTSEIGSLLDKLADAESANLPDEQRKAVAYLLERVFFAPGGDYYRVLGLNRDATPEQIRRHYNQLLHIFFREDSLEEWNPAYAMRINQAYRTLRDPGKRRAYDQSLRNKGETRVSAPPPVEKTVPDKKPPLPPAGAVGKRVKPGLRKPRTQAINASANGAYIASSIDRAYAGQGDRQTRTTLAGSPPLTVEDFPTGIPMSGEKDHGRRHPLLGPLFRRKLNLALVAGIFVVAVFYVILLPPMVRDDPPATTTVDTPPAESPVQELGHVDRADPMPDASALARLETLSTPTEREIPVSETPAIGRPGAEPDPEPQATAAEAESLPPAMSDPGVTALPSEEPPPAVAVTRPSLPPAPVVDVTPARAVATIQELDTLAKTFARSYETGNLEQMLSLFAEDARTNERSNRAGILQDYEELFNITDAREFLIDGLSWRQERDGGLRGEGVFRVNIRFRDDQSRHTLTGDVVIYVEKHPEGIKITEFLHSYHQ
jgi:hypothetical protein